MKWSWNIGSVKGIAINVHATFLILIAWGAFAYWQLTGSPAGVANGLLFIVALFACVVLHELGHALVAARHGVRTRSITLLPIGGVAAVENVPDDPVLEIRIALAGPLVSLGIAAVLWLYLSARGTLVPMEELDMASGPLLQRLMVVNVLLAIFNLLPAFPMDGGRVFRALLALWMEPVLATRIAAGVGQALALVLALLGLMGNPILLFIAIFIWIVATAESGSAVLKATLAGLEARQAMLREFRTLSPADSLEKAVGMTLSGSQKDFPVVSEGRMVGTLSQSDMLRGLQEGGEERKVSDVMQREVQSVAPDDALDAVLERLQTGDAPMVGVVERGRLIGIVNLDNLVELMRIQSAIRLQ